MRLSNKAQEAAGNISAQIGVCIRELAAKIAEGDGREFADVDDVAEAHRTYIIGVAKDADPEALRQRMLKTVDDFAVKENTKLREEVTNLKLQNGELRNALSYYAAETSWRDTADNYGQVWVFDWPGDLGDNPWDIAKGALTEKRKCPVCSGDLPDSCYAKEVNDEPVR
jgi:hypothetical protein